MFGLFIIEAGQEPRALLNYSDGKPIVTETGEQAAQIARMCAIGDFPWRDQVSHRGYEPVKVQPRRLSDDAWKARELARFTDGTYVALPWAELLPRESTADHFAHVSTVDGARIAYTQDAAKGAGDIQTRVKPGRYLAQFYADVFDAPTITRMATEFETQFGESNVLLFATTEREIEHVYVNGPRSCMAHAEHYFASPIHPCRIYAAGDLAVAYMERGGEITARALVWPDKKLYGRVYGDEIRLTDLLDSASYSEGELDGARMLRVEHKGSFVVPYIDGCQCASDNGTHLILGGSGVDGGNQNGLSGHTITCDECSEGIDEDDCHSGANDEGSYCESCYNDRFSYCERTEETCERYGMQEVITTTRNGRQRMQYWSEDACDNHATECEGNGRWYANDLIVTLADGTEWSQEYFEDHGSICEGNGECYAHDDMVQLEDGTSWSKDYFSDNGVTIDGKLYDKSDALETEEDAENATPEVVSVYRASPTVHCDAQIEMPLTAPWHIESRDGLFAVMYRNTVIDTWHSPLYAEADLKRRQAGFEGEVAA